MEPTICKPSIYKGAGIYKIGAEGGGGGGNTPVLPEGLQILESVKIVGDVTNVHWQWGGSGLDDTDVEYIGELKINSSTPSASSIVWNRNGSMATFVYQNGRAGIYTVTKNIGLPFDEWFTLTQKNGYLNNISVVTPGTGTFNSIYLFCKQGYQTYENFKGEFKRFTVQKNDNGFITKYSDVIPVKNMQTEQIGVYDIIRDAVFYNSNFVE